MLSSTRWLWRLRGCRWKWVAADVGFGTRGGKKLELNFSYKCPLQFNTRSSHRVSGQLAQIFVLCTKHNTLIGELWKLAVVLSPSNGSRSSNNSNWKSRAETGRINHAVIVIYTLDKLAWPLTLIITFWIFAFRVLRCGLPKLADFQGQQNCETSRIPNFNSRASSLHITWS